METFIKKLSPTGIKEKVSKINKENMLSIDYIPKNMYIVDNNENNFRNYLIDNIKPMLRIEVKPYIEKLIYKNKLLNKISWKTALKTGKTF